MKLEVGEFYLNARGRIIEIAFQSNIIYRDTDKNTYASNGAFWLDGTSELDLIAHIPKELHYELLRVVNEYHTNKEFKSMIDINFDKRK